MPVSASDRCFIESLLASWDYNGGYGCRLIEDIPDGLITHQPHGLVNHPAWTIGHLNHYHPALINLARGEAIDDPSKSPRSDILGAGSTPADEPGRYADKVQLLAGFKRGHTQVHEAVRQVLENGGENLLAQPPHLARWAKAFTTTGGALLYLMVTHEAMHLGQLSAWRRAMSLPSVSTR